VYSRVFINVSSRSLHFSRPVLMWGSDRRIPDRRVPDRCEFRPRRDRGPMKIAQRFQRWGRPRREGTRPGRTTETLTLNQIDATANPAPAVRYGPKKGNVCPRQPNRTRLSFSTMWKSGPQPRIKPVIARDTTYGVSLLTGTTGGSNFAIPRHEISPHGNGTEVLKGHKAVQRFGAQPEVTRQPSAAGKGSGARASDP
jgi:hypothetical protein